MTQSPDEPTDPADSGEPDREQGAGRKLDEDAAWREIVAHFGDPPAVVEHDPGPQADPDQEAGPSAASEPVEPPEASEERLRDLFQPSWNDPLESPAASRAESSASWDDEGHFVPSPPPPVPVPAPRRRLAWVGLFGSPFVMLVAVVLGWRLPDWVMFGLATGFAGGFVYLVATMPNRRPGDGSGDDGAVV